MSETTTQSKHKFTIYAPSGSNATRKMARCIEETVNNISKEINVIELPVDQFPDNYLVRMGTFSKELEKELQNDSVEHICHVVMQCEDPKKKKIMFGVWKRLKSSEVLK